MTALAIVWFKRDLRVHDQAALANALNAESILALYCWEPTMWQAEDASLAQQAFVGDCLKSLRQALENLGIPLHISSMGILETLNFLSQTNKISALHSHEETGNFTSFAIDKAVGHWCKANQVNWHEYPQNGVIRRLKNRDDWHLLWEARMQAPIAQLTHNMPNALRIALPKSPIIFAHGEDKLGRQKGGRAQALNTLNSFLTQRASRYRGGISSPIKASEASSRLSPYLAWGCVSVKEVVQAKRATLSALQDEALSENLSLILGLKSFESRLHWHCHFMQKLESEPTLELQHMHLAHDAMRDEQLNDIESKRRLNAWCQGQTGWPLVDACLAMLKYNGWINFRMRAMLMSTASYLLWLHWRETGLHLAREFVDYEPGIHWPQVQMQSGTTGINTLRIYNPIKQAQVQDPKGNFVRKWIPALRRVPDSWIFEPYKMPANLQLQYGCVLEKDYPLPLVEVSEAMRYAKSEISLARKKYSNPHETEQILQKHGSRKNRSTLKKVSKNKEKSTNEQDAFQKVLF